MLLVKEISGLEDDKEKELRSVYNRLERLCELTNRPWGGWAGLAACQGRQVPAFYLITCHTWTDLVMMPYIRIPRRVRVSSDTSGF